MLRTFAIALAVATAAPAQAEVTAPLKLDGYVETETVTINADGQREVVRGAPASVLPGDRLIFGVRFANVGSTPIERFVVSNPVPPTVRVSAEFDSAQLVSVDNGKAFATLAELEVADVQGNPRPAVPGDITHIRWILPRVTPGESGQLEFVVTVR